MNCRLCGSTAHTLILRQHNRDFYYCAACALIFVPPCNWVTIEEEIARYELHDNTSDNNGYVEYLQQTIAIIKTMQLKNPKILDFGSGKNCVLAQLLQSERYTCFSYDPLYNCGSEMLSQTYDIIVLNEVAEHVRSLPALILLLRRICNPGTKILLRTGLYENPEDFKTWWYHHDVTHINFFTFATLGFFATQAGMVVLERKSKDTVVLGIQN